MTAENTVDFDWPDMEGDSEGRDEELDDVLEFIHRLSCDAMLTNKPELQEAFDSLHDRLQRQEHRR